MVCVNCITTLDDTAVICPQCGENTPLHPDGGNHKGYEKAPASNRSAPSHPPRDPNFHAASSRHGAAVKPVLVEQPVVLHPAYVGQMPERMRDLLQRLREQVLTPCNQASAALLARRDENQKRLQSEWAQTESHIRQSRAENNKRLETSQSNYDHLRAENLRMLNDAKSRCNRLNSELYAKEEVARHHFAKQRLEVPHLALQDINYVKAAGPFQKAEQQMSVLDEDLKKLTAIVRPEYWWWKKQDLGVALCVAFLVAIFVSIVIKADSAQVFLWIFFLTLAGLVIPIAIIRRGLVIDRLNKHYSALSQAKKSAEFWLLQRQRQAEEYYNKAVMEADGSLSRAQEEHRQAGSTLDRAFSEAQKEHHRKERDEEIRYFQNLADCKSKFIPMIDAAEQDCADFIAEAGFAGLAWDKSAWEQWAPAASPSIGASFGMLSTQSVDVWPLCEPRHLKFSLPAITSFLESRSLLFQAPVDAKEQVIQAMQSILLRLLAATPPGKLRLTLIDPVGLGQNVAPFMPLADHEESLINSRAWTEPQHIEQRLCDLTEHMETVIQKYLRNEFTTIQEYNEQAGEVAEPYRALVVMDFPVNFNDTSARRLVSIAQNGPRCGVHTFVFRDTSKPLPYGFNIKDLEQTANVIEWDGQRFVWQDEALRGYTLELDKQPSKEIFQTVLKGIGQMAQTAMRVEVPYDKLLRLADLSEEVWWCGNTAQKIQVPLGPTGARKLQYLTLGIGTAHHTLVVGRPGSGKSNLMHVIITSLALAYSPEEMQLYLIDFKKGVEFKTYAELRLPHAVVIAIESEREFGLSVLQGLDEQLQRRGELFRSIGAINISEYRQKNPTAKMPRILLLVDEFQEFFTQDDNISRQASLILDRLVRQGRAFGIHVMLGSQTLAGSYSLARSTLDQMAIRIALQCSEADSRLILADDNPAARLLSRPGEAIYNAASGLVEGNHLFQVALFTDEDRLNYLASMSQLANVKDIRVADPIVFEGNNPARLEDCLKLNKWLDALDWVGQSKSTEALLGEPIAISQPTMARFRRQSGSHLLIITRDEEEGIGMLSSAVLSLALQERPENARFFVVDLSMADSSWVQLFEDMAGLLPHHIQVLGRRDLPSVLKKLVTLVNERITAQRSDGPSMYLVIHGLQRARDLREEMNTYDPDEEGGSSPKEMFATLLREGPEAGVHILAWCDTYTNVSRTLNGRMLGEFGQRVAAAMSSDDSSQLLDDTIAARLDKPHRAIFYDEEHPGYLEKFRPYSIPEKQWLEQVCKILRARADRQ